MANQHSISQIRERIKASELIDMLQNNVLDKEADPLHQSKLHAIKILLAKAIPDLKAIEHTGDINADVMVRWEK